MGTNIYQYIAFHVCPDYLILPLVITPDEMPKDYKVYNYNSYIAYTIMFDDHVGELRHNSTYINTR